MIFYFLGLLCLTSKTSGALKSQFHICNYEWVKILFVDGVLIQNLNIVDLVKILEKNQKLHI
jgi:hypothetical protein